MNTTTDTTAPAENLPPRALSLQLLDIFDAANGINNLIVALDLASHGLHVGRERQAMAEACDVLLSRMDTLIDDIITAREHAA